MFILCFSTSSDKLFIFEVYDVCISVYRYIQMRETKYILLVLNKRMCEEIGKYNDLCLYVQYGWSIYFIKCAYITCVMSATVL